MCETEAWIPLRPGPEEGTVAGVSFEVSEVALFLSATGRIRAAASAVRGGNLKVARAHVEILAVRGNDRIDGLSQTFDLHALRHGARPVAVHRRVFGDI